VHHQDPADALGAAGRDVEDAAAGLELAGVDAEEGELADVGVGGDLVGERCERLGVVGLALGRTALVLALDRLGALDRRHVERAGQEVDDGVEQRLDALVLERGAAEDRRHLDVERGLADRLLEPLGGDLLLFEDHLEQLVVVMGDLLEQVLARGGGLVGELGRDVRDLELLAQLVPVEDRLVGDEVDDAVEVALGADRQLDRHRMGAEAVDHRLHAALEVGADAVHLVDVGDAGDAVLVGLAPDRLGLRLDAGDRVEQGDGAVEYAQRALDLDREVDVAGRVDDVDAAVAPVARGRGGRDRDAALLLLRHPVHDRGALVNLPHLVGPTGVIEDALGRGRLARIDVGHDSDVARV